MPRIRSMFACVAGMLGGLLIAGGALLCRPADAAGAGASMGPSTGAGAVDEHKSHSLAAAEPKKVAVKSSWKSLSVAQQRALEPLAGEWDSMDGIRKQKWLAIGNKYAKMSPAEQERLQIRMRDWIKLTPEQRRSVRQSYMGAQNLNPDQKSAQWRQYLQLSEEQKQLLAKQKGPAAPATAITRTKKKPPALLPISPELAHETAIAPVTASAAPLPPVVAPAAATAQPGGK